MLQTFIFHFCGCKWKKKLKKTSTDLFQAVDYPVMPKCRPCQPGQPSFGQVLPQSLCPWQDASLIRSFWTSQEAWQGYLLGKHASILERKDMIKSGSLVLLSDYSLANITTEMSEMHLTWTTMGHGGIHRSCLPCQTWRAGGGRTRYQSGGWLPDITGGHLKSRQN